MILPRQESGYVTRDRGMEIQQVGKDRCVILNTTRPCIDWKSIAVPMLRCFQFFHKKCFYVFRLMNDNV